MLRWTISSLLQLLGWWQGAQRNFIKTIANESFCQYRSVWYLIHSYPCLPRSAAMCDDVMNALDSVNGLGLQR